MNRFLIIFCWLLLVVNQVHAQSPELGINETNKLIQKARSSAKDPKGWATDLIDVLHSQGQTASRENVCAAIAIIDQESNFVENPVVAGLGTMAEKTLQEKFDRVPVLGRVALQFLDTTPDRKNSYLQRIRSARTERDLDLTYRAMIEDASQKSNISFLVQSGLLNQMIEERNNINTIGSMQVSIKFALESTRTKRWLPMSLSDVYAVRDQLYTRKGGMYFGVLQLLGYESGYNKKIFRFADYNAGRYASRNAAFQSTIARLTDISLSNDGDLLLYDKAQKPLRKLSQSEQALRSLFKENQIAINDNQLRTDLELEKSLSFTATQTYVAVKQLAPGAAFAEIPNIQLNSPKIRRQMTTRNFAESVEKRYLKCIGTTL
jgi:Protein of unknown function (DUF1615)